MAVLPWNAGRCRWHNLVRFLHIAYHDLKASPTMSTNASAGQDLGDKEATILRNHGLLVVGRTVPAAFNVLFRLERACQVQIMALSCNTKLIYPPQSILEDTYERMQPKPGRSTRNGELAWPALLRKLDRIDPSYRN
jgi:ribulose-5-phosphate 4-epimerase/fuculose-1-phosphate aldolase